jgi:DHA2 family multidrug resistance protein-like MFS transporter
MFGLLPAHGAVHWGLAMAALAALAGSMASLLRSPAKAGAV